MRLEESADPISQKALLNVWRSISDKPLPKIAAFRFPDKQFYQVLEILQSNEGVTDTRVQEYGVNFDNSLIEACTFEFEGQMIILVKESSDLTESLEHELRHIKEWKRS